MRGLTPYVEQLWRGHHSLTSFSLLHSRNERQTDDIFGPIFPRSCVSGTEKEDGEKINNASRMPHFR